MQSPNTWDSALRLTTVHEKGLDSRVRGNDNNCVILAKAFTTPSLMKILLIHNRYQQPGGEDVVYEQERKLLESYGHEVLTYERKNRDLPGYSVLERVFLPVKTIWAGDVYREVLELINRERPHVAHVHNTFLEDFTLGLRRLPGRESPSSSNAS